MSQTYLDPTDFSCDLEDCYRDGAYLLQHHEYPTIWGISCTKHVKTITKGLDDEAYEEYFDEEGEYI